jgi:hypothetical protein
MDLTGAVNSRFASAAKKASRRISHGPKLKSKVRRAERRDPAERLMDKIMKASRPGSLADKKGVLPKVATNG